MRSPLNEKIKLTLAATIAACTSLTAAAGDKVGKGADALVCYEKGQVGNPIKRLSIELFDIYEAKNDKAGKMPPIFDASITTVPEVIAELARRVAVNDPVRAAALLSEATLIFNDLEKDALGQGEENKVAKLVEGRLRDIPDSYEVVIPENCQLEQLVIQDPEALPDRSAGVRYVVRKDHWNRLNPIEQAATLWHEAIYREASHRYGHTDSRRTRRLNAYAFNGAVASMTRCQYREHLNLLGIPEFIQSDFVPVMTDSLKQKVTCDERGEIRQVQGEFKLTFADEKKSSIVLEDPEFDVDGELARARSRSHLYFNEDLSALSSDKNARGVGLSEVTATQGRWEFKRAEKLYESGLLQLTVNDRLQILGRNESGTILETLAKEYQSPISKYLACGREAFKRRRTSREKIDAYSALKGALVQAILAKDLSAARQVADRCAEELSKVTGKMMGDEEALEATFPRYGGGRDSSRIPGTDYHHHDLVTSIVHKTARCRGTIAGVKVSAAVGIGLGWHSLYCQYSDGSAERFLRPNLAIHVGALGAQVGAVKLDEETYYAYFEGMGGNTVTAGGIWAEEIGRVGYAVGLHASVMPEFPIGPKIRTKKIPTDDALLTRILLSEVVANQP